MGVLRSVIFLIAQNIRTGVIATRDELRSWQSIMMIKRTSPRVTNVLMSSDVLRNGKRVLQSATVLNFSP